MCAHVCACTNVSQQGLVPDPWVRTDRGGETGGKVGKGQAGLGVEEDYRGGGAKEKGESLGASYKVLKILPLQSPKIKESSGFFVRICQDLRRSASKHSKRPARPSYFPGGETVARRQRAPLLHHATELEAKAGPCSPAARSAHTGGCPGSRDRRASDPRPPPESERSPHAGCHAGAVGASAPVLSQHGAVLW